MSAVIPDTVYYKDIKSQRISPGARQEYRYRAAFKGKMVIRISADNAVIINIAGPHIEQVEIKGTREFVFTVEPGTEVYVGLQSKGGWFASSANVTLEVEMYAPKKAVNVYERIKNMVSMLRELPEIYQLQRENVKELLKEVTEVWHVLGDEGRQLVRELMTVAKKLEEKMG